MKKVFLALSFLIVTVNAFAQLSYTQDLSRLAQIQFPDTPSFSSPIKGMSAYTIKSIDLAYVAAMTPATAGLKNAVSGNSLKSLYDDFVNGNLNSTNGTVIYKKEVTIEKLKGLEFSYKGTTTSLKEDFYAYQRVVFLNDSLFTYAVVSQTQLKADDENIKAFFGSFKLKVKAEDISQDADSLLAYKTGEVIGEVSFIAIVFVVIGGVIFMIVKLSRRGKKKQWSEQDFK